MTYQQIAECIRSDQLSARQIVDHMTDTFFKKWYETNYLTKITRLTSG